MLIQCFKRLVRVSVLAFFVSNLDASPVSFYELRRPSDGKYIYVIGDKHVPASVQSETEKKFFDALNTFDRNAKDDYAVICEFEDPLLQENLFGDVFATVKRDYASYSPNEPQQFLYDVGEKLLQNNLKHSKRVFFETRGKFICQQREFGLLAMKVSDWKECKDPYQHSYTVREALKDVEACIDNLSCRIGDVEDIRKELLIGIQKQWRQIKENLAIEKCLDMQIGDSYKFFLTCQKENRSCWGDPRACFALCFITEMASLIGMDVGNLLLLQSVCENDKSTQIVAAGFMHTSFLKNVLVKQYGFEVVFDKYQGPDFQHELNALMNSDIAVEDAQAKLISLYSLLPATAWDRFVSGETNKSRS